MGDTSCRDVSSGAGRLHPTVHVTPPTHGNCLTLVLIRTQQQSPSGEGTTLQDVELPFIIIVLAGLTLWVYNQSLHTAVMCLGKAAGVTLIVPD